MQAYVRAGLPLATVGAGAAVMGAVAGAAAGRAVSKEFVRGEVIADVSVLPMAQQAPELSIYIILCSLYDNTTHCSLCFARISSGCIAPCAHK